MQIYVSIGNSDDKLTQKEWRMFCRQFEEAVMLEARTIHGVWYSLPNSQFQNACITFEISDMRKGFLQEELRALAHKYKQDAIMWHEVNKEVTL